MSRADEGGLLRTRGRAGGRVRSHVCLPSSAARGRPHQQRFAESRCAADPAGSVQRGLSLPGDAPHAVCRLPEGQEGRLPGDSGGGGGGREEGEGGRVALPPPAAWPSARTGLPRPRSLPATRSWLAPTSLMRKLRLRVGVGWRGLPQVVPDHKRTVGGRSKAQTRSRPLPLQGTLPEGTQWQGMGAHRREAEVSGAWGHPRTLPRRPGPAEARAGLLWALSTYQARGK